MNPDFCIITADTGFQSEVNELKKWLKYRYNCTTMCYDSGYIKMNNGIGNVSHIKHSKPSHTEFKQQAFVYIFIICKIRALGLAIGNLTIYLTAANRLSSTVQNFINRYILLVNKKIIFEDIDSFLRTPTIYY